jgi:hypothetical protein
VKCSPVSVRLRIIYHNIYVGSYTNQYLLRYCLEWFLDLFFGSCVKKCQHACGQAVCGWANQVVGTTLLRPRVHRSTISMEDPAPETLTLVPPSMASSALLRRLHAHDVDDIHRCSGWLPLSCCLCVLCFCYSMNKKTLHRHFLVIFGFSLRSLHSFPSLLSLPGFVGWDVAEGVGGSAVAGLVYDRR